MVILGGWVFLTSEVPLYLALQGVGAATPVSRGEQSTRQQECRLQGYLAHKNPPPPVGSYSSPMHRNLW